MHSTFLFTAVLAASGLSLAQRGYYEPEQEWIPSVAHDIDMMMQEFHEWTDFLAPEISAEVTTGVSKLLDDPTVSVSIDVTLGANCDYWLEDIKHQGIAAFNPNPATYQVFRNVKDYGAKGDGLTDDTAAINRAISSGGRCAPGSCNSTTTTPAVVYFPAGTYMISSSIIDYYYTQLIGNPNCLPTIRAFSTFNPGPRNIGLVDGDPYLANGNLAYGSTNVFWRQIRNFILDTTLVPASASVTGIHWPTGQASSIQNVIFQMSSAKTTQHQGIYIESGSGGFMTDLVFNGGLYGGNFGNQQFTMRNFTFNNVQTAINMAWDWGWTYYGLTFNNCGIGVNMSSGGSQALAVGSLTLFDSSFINTPIGILTGYIPNKSNPPTANSLILENISLTNCPIVVQGGNGRTALKGTPSTSHISAWGEGHSYTPTGPKTFQGYITPVSRPATLTQANGQYYVRSKPQYQQYPVTSFISARDQGATGNGRTDDTAALQSAINLAVSQGKILFVDHGDYLVSKTIYIPAGSKIVGETFSVILSYGNFFNSMSSPQPVVQMGKPGEWGSIEWSDMIVSTQGQQQGAILFEYNLASPSSLPSGLWDVHARIGGFTGSSLSLAQCPTTPGVTVTAKNLNRNCIAAFLTFHITTSGSGLYLENDWIWTADHDVDDPLLRQITIYSGRGLLDESKVGTVWMVGTAVEHHTLYQYQFVNTQNVFAGQIQTETPYYQPNPFAPTPFPYNAAYSDPQFPTTATKKYGKYVIPDADAWGLRIVSSKSISVYGAGLYSFFNNYSTTCSAQGNGEVCQNHIFSLEGSSSGITVYNENTVGTHYMITVNGKEVAYYADNLDGFVDTIALFKSAS